MEFTVTLDIMPEIYWYAKYLYDTNTHGANETFKDYLTDFIRECVHNDRQMDEAAEYREAILAKYPQAAADFEE